MIEGDGVDLSSCFVLSTACLQCAEYYLAPVKTPGRINKKFASRVAGRQNALRGCPAGRTQQEPGLAPSARLSDWSAGQLIQTTPGSVETHGVISAQN